MLVAPSDASARVRPGAVAPRHLTGVGLDLAMAVSAETINRAPAAVCDGRRGLTETEKAPVVPRVRATRAEWKVERWTPRLGRGMTRTAPHLPFAVPVGIGSVGWMPDPARFRPKRRAGEHAAGALALDHARMQEGVARAVVKLLSKGNRQRTRYGKKTRTEPEGNRFWTGRLRKSDVQQAVSGSRMLG